MSPAWIALAASSIPAEAGRAMMATAAATTAAIVRRRTGYTRRLPALAMSGPSTMERPRRARRAFSSAIEEQQELGRSKVCRARNIPLWPALNRYALENSWKLVGRIQIESNLYVLF